MTQKMQNEEVLMRIGERLTIMEIIKKRERMRLGHYLSRDCILRDVIESMVEETTEEEDEPNSLILLMKINCILK